MRSARRPLNGVMYAYPYSCSIFLRVKQSGSLEMGKCKRAEQRTAFVRPFSRAPLDLPGPAKTPQDLAGAPRLSGNSLVIGWLCACSNWLGTLGLSAVRLGNFGLPIVVPLFRLPLRPCCCKGSSRLHVCFNM